MHAVYISNTSVWLWLYCRCWTGNEMAVTFSLAWIIYSFFTNVTLLSALTDILIIIMAAQTFEWHFSSYKINIFLCLSCFLFWTSGDFAKLFLFHLQKTNQSAWPPPACWIGLWLEPPSPAAPELWATPAAEGSSPFKHISTHTFSSRKITMRNKCHFIWVSLIFRNVQILQGTKARTLIFTI